VFVVEGWILSENTGASTALPFTAREKLKPNSIVQSKPLRSILNAPWYINNHRTHEDLQMNTLLSEIKKWNIKYLRKLGNHTNALVVNLLDNSETTHRLKRYTVLTLPDRPEENPNTRIEMIPK
jgi:hypothetical protein